LHQQNGVAQADVGKLVFVVAKVIHLQQAFADQRIDAKVGPAQTYVQRFGYLALLDVWK
jgi:hypothetical protein